MPKSPAKPIGTVKNPVKRHKHKDLAYITLAGRRRYTGAWADPESHAKAHRLLAEAACNGGTLPSPGPDITVAEIVDAYLANVERESPPTVSSTYMRVNLAMGALLDLYATHPAIKFGPLALDAVRQVWINQKRPLARQTIKERQRAIVRCFKWAASRELIPPTIAMALETLAHVRLNSTQAKEPKRRRPVPDEHLALTLPKLPSAVRGLVQLQRVTGARAGEILGLRRADIDTTGEVWIVRLEHHKTEHHGKRRLLTIGPKGQEILRRHWVGKSPFEPIFSPRDSMRDKAAEAPSHRRDGQKPNKRLTDRRVGDQYSIRTYTLAIAKAIKALNDERTKEGLPVIPVWTSHELRHAYATEARHAFGPELAQAALGHATADMTEHYAAVDLARATEVAKGIG